MSLKWNSYQNGDIVSPLFKKNYFVPQGTMINEREIFFSNFPNCKRYIN